jgi:hypothetical protein
VKAWKAGSVRRLVEAAVLDAVGVPTAVADMGLLLR